MEKMMRCTVCLAMLVLICGGGISPCLAYYAPLTNITGPTVTQDTETRVTVSVHNPATGQDIPGVHNPYLLPGLADNGATNRVAPTFA